MDLVVSAHPGITKSFPKAPLSFFHSNCCMTIQDKNRRATKDEVVIILSIDYNTQGLCVSNQSKVREASLSRDSLTITLHVKPETHCSGHPEQLKRRSFYPSRWPTSERDRTSFSNDFTSPRRMLHILRRSIYACRVTI